MPTTRLDGSVRLAKTWAIPSAKGHLEKRSCSLDEMGASSMYCVVLSRVILTFVRSSDSDRKTESVDGSDCGRRYSLTSNLMARTCAYCGNPGPLTREHVVPDFLYRDFPDQKLGYHEQAKKFLTFDAMV